MIHLKIIGILLIFGTGVFSNSCPTNWHSTLEFCYLKLFNLGYAEAVQICHANNGYLRNPSTQNRKMVNILFTRSKKHFWNYKFRIFWPIGLFLRKKNKKKLVIIEKKILKIRNLPWIDYSSLIWACCHFKGLKMKR